MDSPEEYLPVGGGGRRRGTRGPPDAPSAIRPLVLKLDRLVPLTDGDVALLAALVESDGRFNAHAEIAREGDGPTLLLIREGLACRQRMAPDGRRQILDFLLPGDLSDQHLVLATSADYSLSTLSAARVTFISKLRLGELLFTAPRLAMAFRWCALQEAAALRERIVALGRRDASGRIAYLLCELYWRHEALGLTDGGVVDANLTQTALADALGLTPVHVSRVLSRFRGQKIIELTRGRFHVLDLERLRAIAWLNARYLHLDGPSDAVMRMLERSAGEAPRA